MRKIIGLGIAICLAMLIIAPVAACHIEIGKVGPSEACTTCDSYLYSINVKSVANGVGTTNFLVRVNDTLPAGLEYVSYTDNGPVPETATCVRPTSALDSTCREIRWDYSNVPHNAQWTITLNVKPVGLQDESVVLNKAQARLKIYSYSTLNGLNTTPPVPTTFKNKLCPVPSPEFPT